MRTAQVVSQTGDRGFRAVRAALLTVTRGGDAALRARQVSNVVLTGGTGAATQSEAVPIESCAGKR